MTTGGQESPCLFNNYSDHVLKITSCEIDKQFPGGWEIQLKFNILRFCANREQQNIWKINGMQKIRWLLCPDDLVLFCKSLDEIKRIMKILNQVYSHFGLTLCSSKARIQAFSNEELSSVTSLLEFGENLLQNVSKLIFFAQTFRNKNLKYFTDLDASIAINKFIE